MDNEGAQMKYRTRRPGCEFYGHQRRKVSLVTEKGKKNQGKKITRPYSMGRTEINKENWNRNFNFQLQVKTMAFFIMQKFQSPQTHYHFLIYFNEY